jgi:hypothetical protein
MRFPESYNTSLCALCALLILSCNNSDKTTTVTNTTDTTSAAPANAPVNTVVTTPENLMIVRHKVANYDKWLTSFESADSLKAAHGLHNDVVGRTVNDSNILVVATTADDPSKAKAFGSSAELKQAMQKSNVISKPTMNFMTTVYRDTAKMNTDLRAMTIATVKDWDTWKTGFESHRQDRINAGLTDRVYGYDPADNHKIIIIVAVDDTAKANAFWNSADLKQKMAESGVIGKPERIVFRISKRYK